MKYVRRLQLELISIKNNIDPLCPGNCNDYSVVRSRLTFYYLTDTSYIILEHSDTLIHDYTQCIISMKSHVISFWTRCNVDDNLKRLHTLPCM